MKNICVFCGSSFGADEIYVQEAKRLGEYIAKNNLTLVYGGGNVGLMGTIADEVLKHKGEVIGVIPSFLKEREVGHLGLSQLHVVDTMHERKQLMAQLSDAFIAMPGGLGTLEELAEITTWVQLEIIKKPTAVLNVNGYYDALLRQLDIMTEQGFVRKGNRKNILSDTNVDGLMESLLSFKFDDYSLWSDIDRT